MLDTIRNAFATGDLRKKILYTLMILVLFRIGSAIPVPFLNPAAIAEMIGDNPGDFLNYINVMTGGALENATVFAMSITPYINASIIMQLLTVAIPALGRWQKEGEEGRKKIGKITRYLTVGLAFVQALGYFLLVRNGGDGAEPVLQEHLKTGWQSWFVMAVIIIAFVAGTAIIVFLGELISQKGIGNGISIILFAGIISRGPSAIAALIRWWGFGFGEEPGVYYPEYFVIVPLIVLIFIAMITFIIIMTNAERRIPVQYSKRVVGRKMYCGQSSHIPIKVSMSGVMPIIFASSLMSMPSMILRFVKPESGFWVGFFNLFNTTSWFYAVLYFLLIIGFNYFYVAIQYNPIEISNNLRKNNGAIPGVRPGKPTSDFIQRVLSKVTFLGAMFLGLIAVFPTLFAQFSPNEEMRHIGLGGTSILIIVGVALETMRTLESQMMMRHHKGFLE